jgi:hypothetical protein
MADQLSVLLERIRELVRGDGGSLEAARLAEMEHTLTDGYASALALDGERARLRRRIGELAGGVVGQAGAQELRDLSERLAGTERELRELRRVLRVLRDRLEGIRSV